MDAIIQLAKFSTFRKVVLMFNIFNAVQMVGMAIFTGIVFINKNTHLGIGLIVILVAALPSLAFGFYGIIFYPSSIVYGFLPFFALQSSLSLVWAIIGPSAVLWAATAFDGVFLLIVVLYWLEELPEKRQPVLFQAQKELASPKTDLRIPPVPIS